MFGFRVMDPVSARFSFVQLYKLCGQVNKYGALAANMSGEINEHNGQPFERFADTKSTNYASLFGRLEPETAPLMGHFAYLWLQANRRS
jgi:hypothetical protein